MYYYIYVGTEKDDTDDNLEKRTLKFMKPAIVRDTISIIPTITNG